MSVESEGAVCPVCESWAEDYEPGVSAVKIDGVWYHPSCVAKENTPAPRTCAWCEEEIRNGQFTAVIALENVHDRCAKEFERWLSEDGDATPDEPAPAAPCLAAQEAAAIPLEQQLRKSIELGRIRDDDLVTWGEWVYQDTPNERYEYEELRWSDLSVYERHTVERQPDGRLIGGYPL